MMIASVLGTTVEILISPLLQTASLTFRTLIDIATEVAGVVASATETTALGQLIHV